MSRKPSETEKSGERIAKVIARAGLSLGTSVKLAVDDRGHVVAATSSAAARAFVQAGVIVGTVVTDHRDENRNTLIIGNTLLHNKITANL